MNYYTQKDLSKIANRISYDWYNNGFYNFYDSESYEDDLTVLKAHAKFHGIKDEVRLLISIQEEAKEVLDHARDTYNDDLADEIYNGDWLEEEFGVDRLEQALGSLTEKLEVSYATTDEDDGYHD